MNISLNKTDSVNGIISIEMERADFQENVKKSLNQFRRNANIPGFRPGKVPMGVVKKLYGTSVLTEEVNKLINSSLTNYIQENKLPILGEPLPKENLDEEVDLEKDEKFTFDFEVGLAPELDLTFDKDDSLSYYKVKLEDELLDEQIDGYKQNFGSYDKVEESALETDMIKGTAIELEDGEPKKDGIVVEEAILMPSYIKADKETKALFVGANAGDEVIINPSKAYDNEAEIASFLNIPKDEASEVTSDFKFNISEITRFKEGELNQELFDKVLGEGVVSDEESFREKIEESLNSQFVPDADYLFMKSAREMMLEKMQDIEMPEEFLKKWLKLTNEEATDEVIEKDFPNIIRDIKYQLVKEKIVQDNEIKTEASDVQELAAEVAQMQFAQYGMSNLPVDMLQDYVKRMLENEETVNGLVSRVIENKIAAWLKENITVEEKEIASEEFSKMIAQEQGMEAEQDEVETQEEEIEEGIEEVEEKEVAEEEVSAVEKSVEEGSSEKEEKSED
ncbi:MAG TPA: trigger factor [Dysgonamonadaceae bacterium]|nr:trigger factor [Dysgonamonadaceae bacterium]